MTTLVGTQNTVEDFLTSAINLENDAIEAYDAVIERLDDQSLASQVSQFREDHYRHRQELSEIAGGHGVEIPNGTVKSMLTSGKIVFADMFGDEQILKAMKTNENDTVSAYENVLEKEYCTGPLRQVCERAHQDELRHRRWMEDNAERLDRAA